MRRLALSLLVLAVVPAYACANGSGPGETSTGAGGAAPSPGAGGAGPDFDVCTPTCAGGLARHCEQDGSVIEFTCDPVQGMACDPDGCKGACVPTELGHDYQGCEYYPTVTMNPVWSGFSFAVGVANGGPLPASVTITLDDQAVTEVSVGPGSLEIVRLPWVRDLKGVDYHETYGPSPSAHVIGGAYRLRSTSPVAVYQFSPLEYQIDPVPASCWNIPNLTECLSQINDASLLLPTNAWSRDYAALTFPSGGEFAGSIEITAAHDGTEITLFPGADATFIPGGGVAANGSGIVVLDAGDVLALHAPPGERWIDDTMPPPPPGPDLSGTRVQASKPVQVIASHACAFVPYIVPFCDHLEESMFPIEAWGDEYVVSTPLQPRGGGAAPQNIRVTALYDGTEVTFDPPIHPAAVVGAGQVFELEGVIEDVRVHADGPILVAQLMYGSSMLPNGEGFGDPSLALAAPTGQYRSDYVILAPDTYAESYINVVTDGETDLLLDGDPIDVSFQRVGESEFFAARVRLPAGGAHRVSAATPFGLTSYGYGVAASYMYPGGLELRELTQPPPH